MSVWSLATNFSIPNDRFMLLHEVYIFLRTVGGIMLLGLCGWFVCFLVFCVVFLVWLVCLFVFLVFVCLFFPLNTVVGPSEKTCRVV